MTALKLIAIGDSTGIIFPKAMLSRMKVATGDTLYVTEAADGSYRLTSYGPGHDRKMDKAIDIIRRFRNTLQILSM